MYIFTDNDSTICYFALDSETASLHAFSVYYVLRLKFSQFMLTFILFPLVIELKLQGHHRPRIVHNVRDNSANHVNNSS